LQLIGVGVLLLIGKDFYEWGYGKSGLLVLSQKPPSYGFIRLDVKPVEWFRFNYIHMVGFHQM
jgi:hypothetical protein